MAWSALLTMLVSAKCYAAPVDAPLPWAGDKPQVVEKIGDPIATLRRVEHYLNSITTIDADFSQIAPDGSLASGKMYIKRPGKMRWEYDPPTPVLMVSNSGSLAYYDYELDQVSHIPLEDTLAAFLAQPDIRLDSEALRVINFREGAGSIRFTLLQTRQTDQGSLTMELSDRPMQIKNLIFQDATGQITEVQLQNAKYDVALPNQLFEFDVRKIRRERGRSGR